MEDPSQISVSIAFDDVAPEGADYQDISKLHSLAGSLNNLERDRCSTAGGMPCNVSAIKIADFIEQQSTKNTDFYYNENSRYLESETPDDLGSDGTRYGQNEKLDMEETTMGNDFVDFIGDAQLWMQQAFKPETKGKLHRRLGIAEGKDIPMSLINQRIAALQKKGQGEKKLSADELELLRELIAARNAKRISAKKDFDQILSLIIELENESMDNEEEVHDLDDHSIAAQEKAISDCIKKGGTREECTEKVKKKMSELKELTDQDLVEEGEEEEEKEPEVKDTVEVCTKEYDMLKEKAAKYDELQKEHDSFKEDFKKFKADFDEIIKEREAEQEEKRQEKIKQLCEDFDIPIDEIKEDSMEDLIKLEKRLDLALKRNKTEDYDDLDDKTASTKDMAEAIVKKYRIEV